MLSLLSIMMILAGDTRPLPTAMWSLSEQELRSRIVGKHIRTADEPPPGLDYVTHERFMEDGRYFRSFHGHEELGTYRFSRGKICVRVDDREQCRTGLTDSNDDLWLLTENKDRTRLQRHAIELDR